MEIKIATQLLDKPLLGGFVLVLPSRAQFNKSHAHTTHSYRTTGNNVNVKETNNLLQKFWVLDSIGIKEENAQAMTPNEMTAVRKAEETQVFKDGRYEIGILWKEGEPKFENNYDMAYS